MSAYDDQLEYGEGDEPDEEEAGLPKPAAPAASALASSIQAGQKAIQQSAVTGPTNTPMEERDSKYYLQELEKIANDPKYKAVTPESSKPALQQALQQAKDLYHQQSDRNDWAQVAQTLGRAVAQFGGALAGRASGVNMANLNMGPEVDYESRNRRALEEYKTDIGNARTEDSLSRQEALDKQKASNLDYAKQAGYLGQGLQSSLKGEAEEAAQGRADTRANSTMARQDQLAQRSQNRQDQQQKTAQDRQDARDQAQSDREDRQNRQAQLKDIIGQEKELAGEITAGRTLANALQQEDDLDPKEAKKLQEKYSGLAGKAGIDLAPALEEYKNKAPKRARSVLGVDIPGTETTDTAKATPTLYEALGLTEKLQKLKDLRTKQQQLIGGSSVQQSTNSGPPPAAQAAPAPAGGRVKVKAPNGTVGTLPAEQLDQALKQGYTQVQ